MVFAITFLGTSGMQPTKERALPSIHLSYRDENILLDCGEGTQRQMRIAGLKPTRLTKILITHNHADHLLGLAGLIRNLVANEYKGTLEIYGPKNIDYYLKNLINCTIPPNITFNIKLAIVKEGIIFENQYFKIEALRLKHTTECFGYSIIEKDKRKMNMVYLKKFNLTQHPILGKLQKGEDIVWENKKITAAKATTIVKGKKLTYTTDTAFCKEAIELAKDSDLLIAEATFADEQKDEAASYLHMTASSAAEIAKKAKAKHLILTHISQRYKDSKLLEKEAKKIFKNVKVAEDFMKVEI